MKDVRICDWKNRETNSRWVYIGKKESKDGYNIRKNSSEDFIGESIERVTRDVLA
jgi:hypothetical protein